MVERDLSPLRLSPEEDSFAQASSGRNVPSRNASSDDLNSPSTSEGETVVVLNQTVRLRPKGSLRARRYSMPIAVRLKWSSFYNNLFSGPSLSNRGLVLHSSIIIIIIAIISFFGPVKQGSWRQKPFWTGQSQQTVYKEPEVRDQKNKEAPQF